VELRQRRGALCELSLNRGQKWILIMTKDDAFLPGPGRGCWGGAWQGAFVADPYVHTLLYDATNIESVFEALFIAIAAAR